MKSSEFATSSFFSIPDQQLILCFLIIDYAFSLLLFVCQRHSFSVISSQVDFISEYRHYGVLVVAGTRGYATDNASPPPAPVPVLATEKIIEAEASVLFGDYLTLMEQDSSPIKVAVQSPQ